MAEAKVVVRPKGEAILGAKVTRTRGLLLPDTPAGGNIQLTLDDGSRITAWKGSSLFQVAELLKDGDEFDFTYARKSTREYPNTSTGDMIEYTVYDGVEIIRTPVEIGGIRVGSFDDIPEELKGREKTELMASTPREAGPTPAQVAAGLLKTENATSEGTPESAIPAV